MGRSQLKRYLEQGYSVEQASTGAFRSFIKNARARERAGRLPERRKKALEQLGVYFDVEAYRYESMLNALREARAKGESLVEGGFTDWIKYQRQKYKDGTLDQVIIDAFMEMDIPLEVDFDQFFNDKVIQLASILQAGEKPEAKLRNFMKRHRTLHRQNKINDERLKAIRKAERSYNVKILTD